MLFNSKYNYLILILFILSSCKQNNKYMGPAYAVSDSSGNSFYYIDTNCNRISANNYRFAHDFIGNYAYVVLDNGQSHFNCGIIDRSFHRVLDQARIIYNDEDCIVSGTFDSTKHVTGFKYYNLELNHTLTFDDYFVKIWKKKYIILQNAKTKLYKIYSLIKNEFISNNLDTIRCDYVLRKTYETNELYFSQAGKEGIMDSTGQIIIQPIYEYIFPLNQKMYIVLNNGNFGIIQKNGIIKLKNDFRSINGIDTNCKIRNSYKYIFASLLINNHVEGAPNYIPLHKNGNNYIYDIAKDKLIKTVSGKLSNYNNNYSILKKNNYYYFIDLAGNVDYSHKYNDIRRFSEDLAFVRMKSKWGVINKNKDLVVNYQFDKVDSPAGEQFFQKAKAIVSTKSKWGVIDFKGNYIIPCIYDKIERYDDFNLLICLENKIYKIYNSTGALLGDLKKESSPFEFIVCYNKKYLLIKSNDEILLFNKNSELIYKGNAQEFDIISDNIFRIRANNSNKYFK